MALTICKIAKPIVGNPSIITLRKEIGWAFEETMAQIFSIFDEKSLSQALANNK